MLSLRVLNLSPRYGSFPIFFYSLYLCYYVVLQRRCQVDLIAFLVSYYCILLFYLFYFVSGLHLRVIQKFNRQRVSYGISRPVEEVDGFTSGNWVQPSSNAVRIHEANRFHYECVNEHS